MVSTVWIIEAPHAVFEMKHCKDCGKEDTEFSRHGKSNKYPHRVGKLLSYCKLCMRTRAEQWQEKNPDRVWKNYKTQKLKEFGITLDQYNEMCARQSNLCAICLLPEQQVNGNANSDEPQMLAVDHCHVTNRVRGLLCTGCNNGLGRFGDNPDRLRRAAAYLEANQ